MEILSAWLEKRHGDEVVSFITLEEGQRKLREFVAPWSFFLKGVDDEDRMAIQRISGVIGVRDDGDYLRVDCKNYWERDKITRRIDEAIRTKMISERTDAEVCEGDVQPIPRLMADLGLDVSVNHRACYVDIEVDSRLSIDDQRAGKSRILSWCVAWKDGDDIDVACAILEEDSDVAEIKLIEDMLAVFDDFDMILAWFGAHYDYDVIWRRALRFDAKMPSGRLPEWNRWCWLDHAEVFRKYNVSAAGSGDEKASMALKNVSARVLKNETKHDFDASRTWESWLEGGDERQRLLRYNIQDTKLLPMIEAETGYIALHREVCKICNVIPHTDSLKATKQGDGYLLRLGVLRGHHWPTVFRNDDEAPTPFEGAWVMEPARTGAIDDVSVCDFAGLYPSIMRSWNMSPETAVSSPLRQKELIAEGVLLARIPKRRTMFIANQRGLVPEALDVLQAKRDTYKTAMKQYAPGSPDWKRASALSSAFKITINSFYGIVGSQWSRFFCVDVAEGVTTTGAWLIQHSSMRAQERGFEPFYGDTDSLFVANAGIPEFSQLMDDLNDEWPGLLDAMGAPRCEIELDFEKRFRRLILVKAKRYAGAIGWYKGVDADTNSPPEVKGLEYKRGDSLRIARRMQEEAINILLRDGPVPDADELREFVTKWKCKIYGDGIELADLIQSQSVKGLNEYKRRYTTAVCKKPCEYDFGDTDIKGKELCPSCGTYRNKASFPPHVRVATVMKERGEDVRAGDRIKFLVRRSDLKQMQAVPAADIKSVAELDLDYYWERKILPPTARVFEVVHPDDRWFPTAKERRAENLIRAQVENKDKVEDLPLFAPVHAHGKSEQMPEPLSTAPMGARRRRKKKKREPGMKVTFEVGSTTAHARAAKSIADASPGTLPLTLVFGLDVDGAKKAGVKFDTGMRVSNGDAIRGRFKDIGGKVEVTG